MTTAAKPYKGLGMDGWMARWYDKNVERYLEDYRKLALAISNDLPEGSSVLEVASGPGQLAVELAKLGRCKVIGLDVSATCVELARARAAKAGVSVDFVQGNAAGMPFAAGTFDFLVCRAAFKNFSDPLGAMNEMHRVLKPGAAALMVDLSRDTSPDSLDAFVRGSKMGMLDALATRWIFRHVLLKRAYTQSEFEAFAAKTPFKSCTVKRADIGLEVRLRK